MRVSLGFDGKNAAAELMPMVCAADRAGMDSVWSAEHLGFHDGIVASALFLAKTTRLRAGIVGINPFSRSPGLLAMELSNLTAYAPGRVRVQLGTGDAALGRKIGVAATATAIATTEAFLSTVRQLTAGEVVTERTAAYTLNSMSVPACQPPPSLELMAVRPRMLALAARAADGVALSMGATVDYLRRAIGLVTSKLAEAGRDRADFTISAMTTCSVDDDLAAARRRAARSAVFAGTSYNRAVLGADELGLPPADRLREALADGGVGRAAALIDDDAVDALAVVATPATLDETLSAYAAAGVDELVVKVSGKPATRAATIALLGRYSTTGTSKECQ